VVITIIAKKQSKESERVIKKRKKEKERHKTQNKRPRP